jgi:hypothetical protein
MNREPGSSRPGPVLGHRQADPAVSPAPFGGQADPAVSPAPFGGQADRQ